MTAAPMVLEGHEELVDQEDRLGETGRERGHQAEMAGARRLALTQGDAVMAALLERFGVTAEAGVDGEAVRRTGESVLLGGGKPVGEVRAVL